MGFFSKPAPPGSKEKVKLPHKQRGKLTSKCPICYRVAGSGICQCKAIAERDRREAAAKKRPITCGQRLASGGTCYKTVVPGETCPRDHSRH